MDEQHLLDTDELKQIHIQNLDSIKSTVNSSITVSEKINPQINAVIWQDLEHIENQISGLKNRVNNHLYQSGNSNQDVLESFPLLGIPVLVKEFDNPIEGTQNSWANKTLKDLGYKDTYTANRVRYLQNAGAIIVGKTNNSEMAVALVTNSQAHGPCKNPHDLSRNSLGSSGGSAASVAAGITKFAVGGDGGGSIRVPAAACGVYGFKTSRGRISNGPMVGESWSGLASSGAFTTSILDMATIIDVLSNFDTSDPYNALPKKTSFRKTINAPISKLKIGYRDQTMADNFTMASYILEPFLDVIAHLESLGHQIEKTSPSSYDDLSIIAPFETIIAAHTHHDVNEISRRVGYEIDPDSLDETPKFYYNLGLGLSVSDYLDARDSLGSFSRSTDSWFDDYDILLTPTIGDIAPGHDFLKDNAFVYSSQTFPGNIAGLPALNIPLKSKHESGMPCGLQIVGRRNNDELVLQLAKTIEESYPSIFVSR